MRPNDVLVALVAAIASCGGGVSGDLPDAGGAYDDAGLDGGGDAEAGHDAGADGSGALDAGAGADPARVLVGPTDGNLALSFSLDASGAGTSRVGEISLVSGAGTVSMGGRELAAVAFEHQPWEEFGYDLFQVLVVAPDRWVILWLYCAGEELTNVYSEATDGLPLEVEPATGSCSWSSDPSEASVVLPAVDMLVSHEVEGYRVSGAEIDLESETPGWIRLGRSEMTVLVFQDVDCSTGCGEPGWYELHAVLSDSARGRACFAILYLSLGEASVLVTYALTLPDLDDPAGMTQLEAEWSVP